MSPCWNSRCITEMDERRSAALEEMQYLLERMLELAERAAGEDCSAEQRRKLQKSLEILRELLDGTAERYGRGGADI